MKNTTSPWACEAFYVNKIWKQIKGILRLIIDYQPLNYFLADDKFPLPKQSFILQHLSHTMFSKFDLKAWQIGVDPEEKPKIAICILDH